MLQQWQGQQKNSSIVTKRGKTVSARINVPLHIWQKMSRQGLPKHLETPESLGKIIRTATDTVYNSKQYRTIITPIYNIVVYPTCNSKTV